MVPSTVTTLAAMPNMAQAETFILAGADAILWEDVNTQAATDNPLAGTVTALAEKHCQGSSPKPLQQKTLILNKIESQADI